MYDFSYKAEKLLDGGASRFSNFLKSLREETKKTLRQIADESRDYSEQISSSLLADAEKGNVIPSLPKLITISKIYQVNPQRFVDLIDLDIQLKYSDLDDKPDRLKDEAKDAFSVGNYSRALVLYEKIIPAVDDPVEKSRFKNSKASCLWKLGKLHWARDEYEEVLSLNDIETQVKLFAYNNLAGVFVEMSNYELALTMARRALSIANKEGDMRIQGVVYHGLANIVVEFYEYLERSDPAFLDEAIENYIEAIVFLEKAGCKSELAVSKVSLGNCYILKEEYEKGEDTLKEGLNLSINEDNKRYIAFAHCSLAKAYYKSGNPDLAKQYFHDSEMVAIKGDYFDLRFENNYYMWLISREEGNEPYERKCYKTLIYLRRKIEGNFIELKQFERYLREKD